MISLKLLQCKLVVSKGMESGRYYPIQFFQLCYLTQQRKSIGKVPLFTCCTLCMGLIFYSQTNGDLSSHRVGWLPTRLPPLIVSIINMCKWREKYRWVEVCQVSLTLGTKNCIYVTKILILYLPGQVLQEAAKKHRLNKQDPGEPGFKGLLIEFMIIGPIET